ncbi:DUF6341 family protein [Tenacibaculum caenipelagi]|uniref:Uracil phosphoribosyltransferase n=1 Tax=Tenacibaculum caenipelagi TaxID=1325435 RepID=A0A4R6TKV1_9FLAO|nr:hypothetical protein [Tenacibaculum caenipelagi]TDQ28791.1 hypothetical protein DFQ07_1171 [Tenacibaculum caenipelagi]
MIAGNIFKWIGSLFTDFLFLPFNWLRLTVAKGDGGWWSSNAINWLFLVVLFVLFAYWMKESAKFLREGTEDRA